MDFYPESKHYGRFLIKLVIKRCKVFVVFRKNQSGTFIYDLDLYKSGDCASLRSIRLRASIPGHIIIFFRWILSFLQCVISPTGR